MRIAIVGSGYVGLVTGTCLAELGHDVVCLDIDVTRLEAVRTGRPAFHEPKLPELLRSVLRSGKLRSDSDVIAGAANADVIILAVGTPCTNGDIDLAYVKQASEQIGKGLRDSRRYQVVAVKSTVIPGTTDTVVRELVEQSARRKLGEFGLCVNPEFLREGSAVDDFRDPDRIVIGQSDERAGQTLGAMYSKFNCPKIFTSLSNAEMIKYASNSLLATLISFSNEIAALCEATPCTDVDEVLDAVHLDRRLSPMVEGKRISPSILAFLRAGCGFGGSCLPKDVTALRAFAEKQGISPRLLHSVLAVNASRPWKLVGLAQDAVGNLAGATVAVLGLAFKAGTDDMRDSPALPVIDLLQQAGAAVRAYDPLVRGIPPVAVTICGSVQEAVAGCDAAIITSALAELRALDWNALAEQMRRPIVIDGRNVLRGVKLPGHIEYVPIGRHYQRKESGEQRRRSAKATQGH